MGKKFNTAGPCEPAVDYMIPAVARLPEAPDLIDENGYFVVHAPRQTGKTTSIRALGDALTAAGTHAALAFSCEAASAWDDDIVQAQHTILDEIRDRAENALPTDLQPPRWPDAAQGRLLQAGLRAWARVCPRPLVLFFDEIDSLQGQALMSVLRQLRAGYNERPKNFPASVILCGLKDVRDYKAAAGGDATRLHSASPFNIKLESLRLGDFTPTEVEELYAQHTAAAGQAFEIDAVDYAYTVTTGQPWLVNALAREVITKMKIPPTEPITVAHLDCAKERLIKTRATHLDSLASKLAEPRVARVIAPLIAGQAEPADLTYNDDLGYLRDLGLIAMDPPVRVANPMYKEVILRILAAPAEAHVTADPKTFIADDGRLDIDELLDRFQDWWRYNSEILSADKGYHEVAPQLIFMAFAQRVVNGGGFIDREFHTGHRRIDVLIRWPYTAPDGKRRLQREVFELKVWRPGQADPLNQGLEQIDGYLDRFGLDQGTLAIFDRRPEAAPIAERVKISQTASPAGHRIRLLRA